jgi:hypothetical protein
LAALTLLSFVLIAAGIITVARPISAIWISSRRRAFLLFIIGVTALGYAVDHMPVKPTTSIAFPTKGKASCAAALNAMSTCGTGEGAERGPASG